MAFTFYVCEMLSVRSNGSYREVFSCGAFYFTYSSSNNEMLDFELVHFCKNELKLLVSSSFTSLFLLLNQFRLRIACWHGKRSHL